MGRVALATVLLGRVCNAAAEVEVVALEAQPWYEAEDRAVARELVSPRNSSVTGLSIADIVVPAGVEVKPHHHMMEEVYHVLGGEGVMMVEDQTRRIGPGDTVVIQPHEWHSVRNDGESELRLFVTCAPAWAPENLIFTRRTMPEDQMGASIRKHYLDLSGGQLHYVSAGNGPPLLLLHQAPLSHAEFLSIIPALAEHFTVYAWDAPGHGNSFTPEVEYEVPDYLSTLVEFVDGLGLDRVSILGHHSGAAFTREFAARYPERTGRIILSGSARAPANPKNDLPKARAFLAQPYSRELSMDPGGEFLPDAWTRYVTLASPGAKLETVFLPFVIGLDARTKPYDMHLAIFRYEDWSDYRTVDAPVMLLAGDGDFFLDRERLDYTCTLFPSCEVHPLIENAGAFTALERPGPYADAIIEFLTGE